MITKGNAEISGALEDQEEHDPDSSFVVNHELRLWEGTVIVVEDVLGDAKWNVDVTPINSKGNIIVGICTSADPGVYEYHIGLNWTYQNVNIYGEAVLGVDSA